MKFSQWIKLRESNNEEAAFVSHIKSSPKDLTNWLVFADWLDERNDPRAGLIRGLAGKKNVNSLRQLDELWERYGRGDFGQLLGWTFPVARYANNFGGRHRKVSLSQTAEVINLIKKPNLMSGANVEKTLQEINKLLKGFGVESVRGGNNRGGYWQDAVAAYVNMGDTYDQTVIFDIIRRKYFISSLGDFVERFGTRYDIQ